MRISIPSIVAAVFIALAAPGAVAAQTSPAGDVAVPPPPKEAIPRVFLEPVEVAPSHRVHAPARSRGRGATVTGAIFLGLGLTSVAAGVAGFATNGYQIVCILGCSAPDYTAPAIFTAAGALVAVLGVGLLAAGASRRSNSRRGRAGGAWVLPTVGGTSDGEGLVLGAVGAF